MMPSGDDDLLPTEGLPTRAGAAADGDAAQGSLAPGARLGRYRVDALLGRGGMGEVYRAEQLEPVRRTVALKLMNARRLDARHLAYFEVERQLLAHMKHPAIAQVFDAGATPEGFPFFAMEYIEGSPLTTYCESRRLPLPDRLRLFVRVCEGVQHAHQKGVIHRDLKPGNILVTEVDGQPLPKIIDFGIATAASRSLVAGEALGEMERAGTPDYMSPEQAGLDGGTEVDTRSDVYSLGVLLYELLAGRRPGAGGDTGAAMHTGSTTLRPPSEQIDTLAPGNAAARAGQLGLSRPGLRRALRGELDWVVLKAMRRDRAQRYSSAAELAEELRRFLDDRPLHAVPASRAYVAGKYFRRHRIGLSAAAAVAVAVLAGLALSLYGLQQARQQRLIAEQRSAELEKVAAFQQSMLEAIDVEAMGAGIAGGLREQVGKNAPDRVALLDEVLANASPPDLARRLVDRNVLAGALAAIDRDFADQPDLAADLRESVARVQLALGLPAEAEALFRAVAEYREQAHGVADREALHARGQQTRALLDSARPAEALERARADLATMAAFPEDDDLRVDARIREDEAIAGTGDRIGARDRQQAYLDELLPRRGERDPQVLSLMTNLGISFARTGEMPKARALFEKIYVLRREVLGPEDEDTLGTMSNLAVMRAIAGDLDEALAMQRERLAISERQLGAEHPLTLDQRGNLGNMLLDDGQMDAAEVELRATLEARTRVLGPESPQTLRSRLNLSSVLVRQQKFDEGLAMEQSVVEARTRVLGAEHPDTLFATINHAGSLLKVDRYAESDALITATLPVARRVLGTRHPQFMAALSIAMRAAQERGRPADALAAAEELLALRIAAAGPTHPETALAAASLSRLRRAQGDAAGADTLWTEHVAPLLAKPEAELGDGERRAVERIRENDAAA